MSQALELGKFDPTVLWMCALAQWQLGLNTQRAKELAGQSLDMNRNSSQCGPHDGAMTPDS